MFDLAMAQVGCPDRRIDRLGMTCCSPHLEWLMAAWDDTKIEASNWDRPMFELYRGANFGGIVGLIAQSAALRATFHAIR
jgi:hypothetical protein